MATITTTFKYLVKQFTTALLIVALLLPFTTSQAFTIYPVTAQLATGDITSAMIRDGTIVAADASSTSPFQMSALRIGTSTTNGLLALWFASTTVAEIFTIANSASTTNFSVSSDGSINTGIWKATAVGRTYGGTGTTTGVTGGLYFADSTIITQDASNLFWDNTNKKLGVASSTPSATVSINGTLAVTGSTTFNNLGLLFPSTHGASGTAMLTNGAGGLSFGAVTDKWQRLISTTTQTNMSELTIDLSSASSTHYQVMFFWPSQTGNGTGAMRFNNDAGASMYYSRTSYNNAADSTGVGTAIELVRTPASTDGAYCIIDIINIRSQNKAPKWACSTSPVTIGTPNRFDGVGLWPVSTSTISSIQFRGDAGGATSFVAGSIITVWGSDN